MLSACRRSRPSSPAPWPSRSRLLPRPVLMAQALDGRCAKAREYPVAAQPSAEPLVEADRRPVPVEHRPFHAPAAARDRDPGQGTEQHAAGALTALLGDDEEILEIE